MCLRVRDSCRLGERESCLIDGQLSPTTSSSILLCLCAGKRDQDPGGEVEGRKENPKEKGTERLRKWENRDQGI